MAWGNFITLPCPLMKWDGKLKNLMLAMLPSVGAVVGGLFFLLMLVCGKIGLPDMVVTLVAEFYMFYIHGFMHLDGFMDCTDAIMSRRDLAERQRIMKDSNVGSFAVVMVAFLLIGWFACFYTMISAAPLLVYGIVLVPVISRAGAGYQVLTYKPIGHSQYVEDYEAKDRGKYRALVIIQQLIYMVMLYVLYAVVIGIPLHGMIKVFCINLATSLVTFLAGAHARKQLGGMSGDIAGYSIIWGEFAGVLTAAICTAF